MYFALFLLCVSTAIHPGQNQHSYLYTVDISGSCSDNFPRELLYENALINQQALPNAFATRCWLFSSQIGSKLANAKRLYQLNPFNGTTLGCTRIAPRNPAVL